MYNNNNKKQQFQLIFGWLAKHTMKTYELLINVYFIIILKSTFSKIITYPTSKTMT